MRLFYLALALVSVALAAPDSVAANQPCPVDFSDSGLSDEQIVMFCAEFENNHGSGGGQNYTFYELVTYYEWASRLHHDFESSDPKPHIP